MKCFALILLAGNSTRFHNDVKKQFYLVNDKPLIYYTIKSFELAKNVDGIILVVQKDDVEIAKDIVKKYEFRKVKGLCYGGSSRQESVYNGLNMLSEVLSSDDYVIIHDGARPLVKENTIDSLLLELKNYHGVTTALETNDTIAMVDKSHMEMVGILDRSEIYQIQTPQAFRFGTILEAHELYKGKNVTDDTQLLQGIMPVKIVKGEKSLLKITSLDDIKYLETFLNENDNI